MLFWLLKRVIWTNLIENVSWVIQKYGHLPYLGVLYWTSIVRHWIMVNNAPCKSMYVSGFGPFCATTPKSVVPSSWRAVDRISPRITAHQNTVCEEALKRLELENHPVDAVDRDPGGEKTASTFKSGLKSLFSVSSSNNPKLTKIQNPDKIYLSAILYNEDKILMTNEEQIPCLEICDRNFNGSKNDLLNFLFKISSNCWFDAERLKKDLIPKLASIPSFDLKIKLINAVVNFQHILGISDLGKPYHRIIDNQLVLINR